MIDWMFPYQTWCKQLIRRLGLADHLSPSRRNGLGAMVEKIRFYASEG